MRRKKSIKPPPGFTQMEFAFDEGPSSRPEGIPKVVIPIETTFDVAQGKREVLMHWKEQNGPIDVELAEDYVTGVNEIFDPSEEYLIGKGGLINTSVFINLLRCAQSVKSWSENMMQSTGTYPIRSIVFEPPNLSTKVGKIWQNLNIRDYYDGNIPDISIFQSRYITPIMWVSKENAPQTLQKFTEWLLDISDRLADRIRRDLIMITDEVITNLVRYGFSYGFYCVSIWPSGQIEIVWSNSIEHLKDWPPEETAGGIITGLQTGGRGGAGMKYIFTEVLPSYNGILAVNCKGNNIFFHASGKYSLSSQCSLDRKMFLPTSILFTLHLFCPTTREKSEEYQKCKLGS